MVTLGIIGSLATAMGSACSKYNKVLLPGVLATLADAKVTCLLHTCRPTQQLHISYTTVDCELLDIVLKCSVCFAVHTVLIKHFDSIRLHNIDPPFIL